MTATNQQSIAALLEQAVQAQTSGDFALANQNYQQALTIDPLNASARHNLGLIQLQTGALKDGVAHLKLAMQLAPNEPALRNTRRTIALTLYQTNLWEDALFWFEQVMVDNPDDAEVLAILERIRPRGYLAPEVYSPGQGEVLKRYSPRENASYVYVVDIVGTCNLRCPSCPVGNFQHADRPKGFMSIEMFQSILEKIEREKLTESPELFLFNWGEPLLHPELPAFVRAANQFGFPVMLSSNLNMKVDFEALVASQPKLLKISLSGFSQETYAQTHARGKFDVVLANLRKLRQEMDAQGSDMQVVVNQHLYKHNAHESAAAEAFCQELGFTYSPIQAFFQSLERVKEVIDGNLTGKQLPVLDLLQLHPRQRRDSLAQVRSGDYDCELRFNQTVINYDGSVALCCGVYNRENMLGVQFLESSHKDIERLRYSHQFCKTCKHYQMDYSPSSV